MTSSIGDMYSANRNGPRVEPCGTPDDRMVVSERSSPTAIYCDRSVTKDCNQSRAVPLMANLACARLQRTEWSTASNAADMSSASSTEQLSSPAACSISFTTFKSAVLVE